MRRLRTYRSGSGAEDSRAQIIGLAALALCCAPSLARGQSLVVLVGDEAPDPPRVRAAAIEVLAEHGVRLVRAPDGTCDDDPMICAATLARRTGADATLLVEATVAEPSVMRVRAVPPEGDAIEASQEVVEADFARATAACVEEVLAELRPTVGFLMVRTDPTGARVEIDGEEVGTSPLRVTVPPGEHTVRAIHEAGTREETIEISANEEGSIELGLESEPSPDGAPSGPRATRSEPSPFNWIIGGGLAVGGVVALISPLSTLTREGQCVATTDAWCVERVHFGVQSGVLLAIGLAALAAAVIIDAAAPIRVEVAVAEDGARLSVGARF